MDETVRADIAAKILALRHHCQRMLPDDTPQSRTRFSQTTLAAYIGVSQQRYSDYETGKADIPLHRLRRIYHYLGGDFAEIVRLYSHAPIDDDEEADLGALALTG
jgi:transcriptional regulator with XRE-family HTH domain